MKKISQKLERKQWTEFVTGEKISAPSKYRNERTGKYPSKKQADYATKLHALARAGIITQLQEEVPITLVPGRDGIKPVIYKADFVFWQDGQRHVLDTKGFRTQVYQLKKRLAKLLLDIEIEES